MRNTFSIRLELSLLVFALSTCSAQVVIAEGTRGAALTPTTASGKNGKKLVGISDIPGVHFSQKLPTNFPIPPYTTNVVQTSFINTTMGRPSATESIETKDNANIVYKWYQDFCQRDGWSINQPPDVSNKGSKTFNSFSATKGKQEIQIMCLTNARKTTSISVRWMLKKEDTGK